MDSLSFWKLVKSVPKIEGIRFFRFQNLFEDWQFEYQAMLVQLKKLALFFQTVFLFWKILKFYYWQPLQIRKVPRMPTLFI